MGDALTLELKSLKLFARWEDDVFRSANYYRFYFLET